MSRDLIIGSIVTILFTALGIIITLRSARRRSIKYFQVEPSSIFARSIKDVSKLKLFYEGVELSEDIILLRVLVLNDGNRDIDKDDVFEPLKITFQSPIRILEISPEGNPKGCSFSNDQNSIVCTWHLLKKSECFALRVVLVYDVEKAGGPIDRAKLLRRYTNVTCRITDLNNVKKESYNRSITGKPRLNDLVFNLVILLMLMGSLVGILFTKQYDIGFALDGDNGSKQYTIVATSATNLKLSDGGVAVNQSVSDFNGARKIQSISIVRKSNIDLTFFIMIFVVAFLPLTTSLVRLRKDVLLRKHFKKNE
jgi:hypothetical protein